LDGEELCVQSSRAAVRLAAAGHFPVIGQLEDRLYISAAHGSHGILSSLMGAQILAAQLCGGDAPVSDSVVQKLSPQRFS
jgi:tRNA 5-methylaminomethyl-2-thiouridine biosynthesis bifunctional protein